MIFGTLLLFDILFLGLLFVDWLVGLTVASMNQGFRQTKGAVATESPSTLQAAIYARVSATDQTCEMQVRELREYVARGGWTVVNEYVDTGLSGAKASRPELDRFMRDAALCRFDAVLVYELDRFGRSVRNCLDGIAALGSHGVRFLAVSQSIDTDHTNPTAKLLLHIQASVAEFERELIRERVCAGVRNAKRKRKILGQKRVVFDRHKATELHRAGSSVREIAQALQVGRSTVHRLLRREEESTDTNRP